jgi:hypothetical protein
MSKALLSVVAAAALLSVAVRPSLAQEITQPAAQPVPVLAGQSGGAGTSGGSTSGGATARAPAAEAPAEPLPAGPPAGPQQAAFFANPLIIGGAVAVTAIVICAIVCFSHSSSTTTSTNVTH